MIDAYTIGVTLALEDGVSEGIEAIRRDLAQLDVAVAQSEARLLQLRELATEAGLAVQAVRPGQTERLFAPLSRDPQTLSLPAIKNVAQIGTAPVSTPSLFPALEPQTAVPKPEAGVPGAALSAVLLRPSDTLAATPLALPQATRARTAAPVDPARPVQLSIGPEGPAPSVKREPQDKVPPVDFAAIARSLTPIRPASTSVSPLTVQEAASARNVSAPIPTPSQPPPIDVSVVQPPLPLTAIAAPAAPPASQQPTKESPASPTHLPDKSKAIINVPRIPAPYLPSSNTSSMELEPPQQVSPTARPLSTAVSPPPRRPALQPGSPSFGAPASSQQSAAPLLPMQRQVSSAEVRTPPSAQPDSADSPTVPPQSDRPVHAELHLDGALLGRWVTRYIERQVTRPQSGATGFDPRMTPSWVGAPIGN